jgi:hypothetical protein
LYSSISRIQLFVLCLKDKKKIYHERMYFVAGSTDDESYNFLTVKC